MRQIEVGEFDVIRFEFFFSRYCLLRGGEGGQSRIPAA
jgi:hypothetical protein